MVNKMRIDEALIEFSCYRSVRDSDSVSDVLRQIRSHYCCLKKLVQHVGALIRLATKLSMTRVTQVKREQTMLGEKISQGCRHQCGS